MTTRGRHRAPGRHARPKNRQPKSWVFSLAVLISFATTVVKDIKGQATALAAEPSIEIYPTALASENATYLDVHSVDITSTQSQTRETVPFKRVEKKSADLARGTEVIQRAGTPGKQLATYTVKFVEGNEVSRSLVRKEITDKPTTEIVLVGTGDPNSAEIALKSAAEQVGDKEGNQAYAKVFIAQEYGWDEKQFGCLVNLWNRESNWRSAAHNKHSGAHGIPQALPGRKMAEFGDDWKTNPVTQIKWGAAYIERRYDTPCGAWAHSESHNWY